MENNLAVLLIKQNRLVEAAGHVETSLRQLEELGQEAGKANAVLTKAELEYRRGNLVAAEHSADEALELAGRLGETATTAEARQHLGEISARREQSAEADSHFAVATEKDRTTLNPSYRYRRFWLSRTTTVWPSVSSVTLGCTAEVCRLCSGAGGPRGHPRGHGAVEAGRHHRAAAPRSRRALARPRAAHRPRRLVRQPLDGARADERGQRFHRAHDAGRHPEARFQLQRVDDQRLS